MTAHRAGVALIDVHQVRFSGLVRGPQLDLYMTEGRLAVATEPQAMFPETAGPLPWFAV